MHRNLFISVIFFAFACAHASWGQKKQPRKNNPARQMCCQKAGIS